MLKKYDDQRFRNMILACLLLSADNAIEYSKIKNLCADICAIIFANIPQNKENLQISMDYNGAWFSVDICKKDGMILYGVDVEETLRGALSARIRKGENIIKRFEIEL